MKNGTIVLFLDHQVLVFEQQTPRSRVTFIQAHPYDSAGSPVQIEWKQTYRMKVAVEDTTLVVYLGIPYRLTAKGFKPVDDDYKVYSAVPALYVTDLRDLLGDIATQRDLTPGGQNFVDDYGRIPRRKR